MFKSYCHFYSENVNIRQVPKWHCIRRIVMCSERMRCLLFQSNISCLCCVVIQCLLTISCDAAGVSAISSSRIANRISPGLKYEK